MQTRDQIAWFLEAEPFWIDPIMEFANFADIPETPGEALYAVSEQLWDDIFSRLRATSSFISWNVAELHHHQAELRTLLKLMAGGRSKRRVIQATARAMGKLPMQGVAELNSKGELEGRASVQMSFIPQWYGAALAALIHEGLDQRVRRCPDRDCEKFFVDWPRRGPKRVYCCKQHQDRDFKRKHR